MSQIQLSVRSRTRRFLWTIVAGCTALLGALPLDTQAQPPPIAVTQDPNPATFSVRGPVDPNTEGIRYMRGTPATPQVPLQPGNPIGFGIRAPASAPASGLPTMFPGDVFDYFTAGVPSEAVFFQSEPLPPPMPPSGNNNQMLEAAGAGLMSGPAVPAPGWVMVPPFRDDVDAISFGEDYISPAIALGIDPASPFPAPPMVGGPFGPKVGVMPTPWAARGSVYAEPMVIADGPGQRFLFSVDAWATGAPGTWVNSESGGMDAGAGLGPWMSPGAAAGDVFSTAILSRAGGVTVGPAMNFVEDNNPMLALAPMIGVIMAPREDDLDGLERVGSSSDWMTGLALTPGSIDDRTMPPALLLPPGVSARDVVNSRPVFFSVKRNSTGAVGSAVYSQFVNDGGAAADIFVAVKDPAMPIGTGTNLLFADEAELGLLAADASPAGTAAMDYSDNLDALILYVSPAYRPMVIRAVSEILGGAPYFVMGGAFPWAAGPMGSVTGGGMTISILQYLRLTGRPMPGPTDVQCAFSVSTDAIGLEFSAVDHEAGPVGMPGMPTQAAGDIFYATLDGTPMSGNWLWHEGVALGLDEGTFVPGMSVDLALLGDNLDALDSDRTPPAFTRTDVGGTLGGDAGARAAGEVRFLPSRPNPFRESTVIRYALDASREVRLAIYDVTGERVTTLFEGRQDAGEHGASWDGRAASGTRAAPGIYYAKLEAGSTVVSHRIVMVK